MSAMIEVVLLLLFENEMKLKMTAVLESGSWRFFTVFCTVTKVKFYAKTCTEDLVGTLRTMYG